ncbi:hypothetical protein AAG906_012119 [Vitis piasezkii]
MGFSEDEESVVGLPNKSIFRYNSPLVQVCLIGLMGGGGQVDATATNNYNIALYTTFAIFGILGGGIYNILSRHFTLFTGCSTYVLYVGSFLYYNHYQHQGFAIVIGAILGIRAGLLWVGKGSYISLFWSIFNMKGVIGGLIPFILTYKWSEVASVNNDTYIGFMCFMSVDTVLKLAILHSSRVVRDCDSHCTNIKYSNVSTEAVEILKLFRNWKMLLMVPVAWASTRRRPTPKTHLVRGWDYQLFWEAERINGLLCVKAWLATTDEGNVRDMGFQRSSCINIINFTSTPCIDCSRIIKPEFLKNKR